MFALKMIANIEMVLSMLSYLISCNSVTIPNKYQSGSAWSHFRGNYDSSGRSTYTGPHSNNLKWNTRPRHNVSDAIYYKFTSSPSFAADSTAYIGSWDRALYAITPEGSVKWYFMTKGAINSSPAIGTDGVVYVGSFDKYLYAINSNGTLSWKYFTNSAIVASPSIAFDGTIFVGGYDENFYAIDYTGSFLWVYHMLNGCGVASSPVITSQDIVLVGGLDGALHALHYNGSSAWVFNTNSDQPIYATPALDYAGNIYIGSHDMYLYALTSEGTLMWQHDTGAPVDASAAISIDGYIYIAGAYSLYALFPNGTTFWELRIGITLTAPYSIFQSSPAIGADGLLYQITLTRTIYVLNSISGSIVWHSSGYESLTSSGNVYSSPSISADGSLYFGDESGFLYCFNSDAFKSAFGYQNTSVWSHYRGNHLYSGLSEYNGPHKFNVLWNLKLGEQILSSPAIGTNNQIFIGTYDYTTHSSAFYSLNSQGSVLWLFETSEPISSSSAIAADGSIYFGCQDNYVYALNPNGSLKWKYLTRHKLVGDASPAIDSDGTIYIADDSIYAIYPSGFLKWTWAQNYYPFLSSPAIAVSGVIYIGSPDGGVLGFDNSGNLVYYFTDSAAVLATPAFGTFRNNFMVFVGSIDEYFYALSSSLNLVWTFKTQGSIVSSAAIDSNNNIYLTSFDDGKMYALNVIGSLLWSFQTNYVMYLSSPIVTPDKTLYFATGGGGQVYSVSTTGSLLWTFQTDYEIFASPCINSDNILYIASSDGSLYALYSDNSTIASQEHGYQTGSAWNHFRGNNSTGSSKLSGPTTNYNIWSHYLGAPVASTAAIASDNTVYIGSNNNSLSAVTPAGSVKWSYYTLGPVTSSPAIAADGSVYFGCYDQYIYALCADGSLKWKRFTLNRIDSSPVIGNDGVIYIGGNNLFALYPDGYFKWVYTSNAYVFYSSPVIGQNNILYCSSIGNIIFAFDTTVGQIISFFNHSGVIYSSPVVSHTGVVYFGSSDWRLYALTSDLRSVTWTFKTGDEIRSSAALGFDGIIYVGSFDRNMYALNTLGSLMWKFTARAPIFSSPLWSHNNILYFGSNDANVYAVSTQSQGSLLWKYQTEGSVQSSPSLSSLNVLYIGSGDGRLYAFYTSNTVNTTLFPTTQTTSKAPSAIPPFPVILPSTFPSSESPAYPSSFPTRPTTSNSHQSSTNTAAIGGGTAAGLLVLCLCVFSFVWLYYSRKSKTIAEPLKNIYFSSDNGRFTITEENPMRITSANLLLLRNVPSAPRNKMPSSDGSHHSSWNNVSSISWNNINLISKNYDDIVIGKGTFGLVVKALMKQPINVTPYNSRRFFQPNPNSDPAVKEFKVAVKVLTKSFQTSTSLDKSAQAMAIKSAIQEVYLIREAESKIVYKECIIKVHGVAKGILPKEICDVMNLAENSEAVGIVMRYEGGGSLQALVHMRPSGNDLPLTEKIRLLRGIARGLGELHTVGIIHADIKPDNILLSDAQPSDVRLADFGLSTIRTKTSLELSSLAGTSHTRGTPIYCAPELLHNPYADYGANNIRLDHVAKSSRKTDMYAFAIVAWEVLTEQKPFQNAPNEIVLSSMIHQGQRPNLKDIPLDCPKSVVRMIEACWSADRSKRRSAVECYSILNYQYGLLYKSTYDVYLSHEGGKSTSIACAIFHRLTQLGVKVYFNNYYDAEYLGVDFDAVSNCKAFLPIVSSTYPRMASCMNELREAKSLVPPRPIVPIFIEGDWLKWSEQEFTYLLQLRSMMTAVFDASLIAADVSWESEEGATESVISNLNSLVDNLMSSLTALLERQ